MSWFFRFWIWPFSSIVALVSKGAGRVTVNLVPFSWRRHSSVWSWVGSSGAGLSSHLSEASCHLHQILIDNTSLSPAWPWAQEEMVPPPLLAAVCLQFSKPRDCSWLLMSGSWWWLCSYTWYWLVSGKAIASGSGLSNSPFSGRPYPCSPWHISPPPPQTHTYTHTPQLPTRACLCWLSRNKAQRTIRASPRLWLLRTVSLQGG